jgi:2-polyprenyl-6-methoxyphenol hydroxylase-like FAD-dependent oxidoreductase
MDGNESRRALIIGAGPGGLTAAIALRRVGIEPVVFERAPELRSVGAGIGVGSNALRALMKLGIGDRIMNAGTEVRVQEISDLDARPLLRFPIGEVSDAYGTPTISMMRADLQLTLVDALPDGVVQTGSECVEVRQDDEGVTAILADGRAERGALLVGADGGRSLVRGHVFGAADTAPRYSGFTSWRAVVESDLLPQDIARTFLGAGTQFVMFPVGAGRVYWGLMKSAPEGGVDPPEGPRPQLLRDLAAFPGVARELVSATDEAAFLRSDVFDRDPDSTWIRDRVVLLGDAAHMTTPFVGQGAGISMEDSVVLAKELSLTDGLRDQTMIGHAFGMYEKSRMRRCSQVVLTSRRRGNMFAISNSAVVAARNAIFRRLPERIWYRQLEHSNSYDV